MGLAIQSTIAAWNDTPSKTNKDEERVKIEVCVVSIHVFPSAFWCISCLSTGIINHYRHSFVNMFVHWLYIYHSIDIVIK